jgi:hypothetical protein
MTWVRSLVQGWCRDLSPAEFKLAAYFYRWAAEVRDGVVHGVVRRPRAEIARATKKIRMRDIRPMLKRLGERGVFEVVSLDREETEVRVGKEHHPSSLSPAAASVGKRPATIANLKEMVFRLSDVRVGVAEVEEFKSLAEVDDHGLMEILDSMLSRGHQYDGLGLLKSNVRHEAAAKRQPGLYRNSPASLPPAPTDMVKVGRLVDYALAKLSGSECKIVLYLLAAASDSPDGRVSQSHEEIASATGLSWRTVLTVLHSPATRRIIQIDSRGKERMLLRFPRL